MSLSTTTVGASPVAGPLSGLRVIEIASFVAGPLGGLTLAQLGADVIRIDPIGGAADIGRLPVSAEGVSLYWAGLNKSKRSVVVDFRSPRGQELISELVRNSGPGGGIVLTNTNARSFLRYEHLRRERPDLIHLLIQGRHDGSTAIDYTVNAALGFPSVTGPEGHGEPVNHTLPAWDIACGLYTAVGLLAAERWRRQTGEGRFVRIALEDVALASAGNLGFLAEAQVNKTLRPRYGNFVYGVFGTDFRTLDGRVMVVVLTERHWQDLVALTGIAEVVAELDKHLDLSLSTDAGRFQYREVIAGLLRPWFEVRTLREVEDALAGTSLLWSRYRDFVDVVSEEAELAANPMMGLVDQPGVGQHLAPGTPLDLDGFGRAADRRAPVLGEHTDAVLREMAGLMPDEVAALHRDGIVAGPAER